MASWVAINVEDEDDASIELDDTKEIQLEEALKLYQNALRLHSLGSAYFDEAKGAYDELFRSEVFRYPEAASLFDHDDEEQSTPVSALPIDATISPVTAGGAADNANSLPQLIYLAYKNRAQFEIDVTRASHTRANGESRDHVVHHYESACKRALSDAAAALERDDTDIDLWKRAGRMSDVLQTVRIVRFCFESVLAGDDDDDNAIDLSGLDEAYANGELQAVLEMLEDNLAVSRKASVRPKDRVMDLLKQSNDPYPFFPQKPKQLEYVDNTKRPSQVTARTATASVPSMSYAAVTRSLLKLVNDSNAESATNRPVGAIRIELPEPAPTSNGEIAMKGVVKEDGSIETIPESESPASFHSVPDRAASAAASLHDKDSAEAEPEVVNETTVAAPEMDGSERPVTLGEPEALPSRKRSSTAAGIEEPEARSKSKRIKARESHIGVATQEEEVVQDPNAFAREQLSRIEAADDVAFKFTDAVLEKIRVRELGMAQSLRENHSQIEDEVESTDSDPLQIPRLDLRRVVKTWNEEKTAAFASGHGTREHVEKSSGLALFVKHSKSNVAQHTTPSLAEDENFIHAFAQNINSGALQPETALYEWLQGLVTSSANKTSPYLAGLWSEELKQAVVDVITSADEAVAAVFQRSLGYRKPHYKQRQASVIAEPSSRRAAEFAQSVFELHLDVYSEITNPASKVDEKARREQMFRLQEWAYVAADTVADFVAQLTEEQAQADEIVLRYLWASVIYAKHSESTDKFHVLLCLDDLRQVLDRAAVPEIILPNNAAMSLISQSAREQEMSKVRTLDFFMSVFDSDNSDPVSVITKLEPILEYDSAAADAGSPDQEQIESFRTFLATGDASLTLFLWRRLQNAYTTISYNTKVVSCLLRSLETVVKEVELIKTRNLEEKDRQITLLKWIRDAEEFVTKIIAKVADDKNAFECIDEQHLQSSMSAVVALLSLLYEFVLCDDHIRCGVTAPPPHRNTTAGKNFEKARDRFRELYIKLWSLLYHMLKEATIQLQEKFQRPNDDLVLFLRHIHNSIGPRQYCRYCNKLFVRIAKAEMFSLATEEDLALDQAQIVHDLYGIRLYTGWGDADHGCAAENLDRDKQTALTLVPVVIEYVKRLNFKDSLRNELKATVDRIQSALGQAKPSPQLSFNRRAISAYLKSVINPRALYQCIKGIGELETKPVSGDHADVAAQGWYLLLGNITLAKYRSVKRVNPTPTDELDIAQGFLRQDLEHGPSNWETWYRLAQVYDAKIEDSLIWNSNKLNDQRADLATLERNAVNAYTMATAIAMRDANDDLFTRKMVNDMFFEFAYRLYASSRPPLNMEAFSTEKAVRHLSSYYDQTMSRETLYKPITDHNLWTLAAHLIRRSLSGDAKPWQRYYVLGKCLWKMINHPVNSAMKDDHRKHVSEEDVLDAFTEAVERVPKKERSADPILEPHHKLVSTIHKMQERRLVSIEDAVSYLQATQYAKNVQVSVDEQGQPDWENYILRVLKKLRTADKSGWHHRITARAARVLYHEDNNVANALGAKAQFVDSIFTKSMMMQVWKPENERPGRHYVYTGRYLRFFTKILVTLRDRSNLEQVVRRIRRKTTDFIDHPQVWEDAVTSYVDLLRSIGNVPRGRERAIFDSTSFEEWSRLSEKLETWAHDPATTTQYLDTIKDAVEIKKLNNSLMKGSAIDDLIGDAYACMYEHYVSQLPPEEKAPPVPAEPTLPQGSFLNLTNGAPPSGDANIDRMRLNNLLAGQTNGSAEVALSIERSTPGLNIPMPGGQAADTPPPDLIRVPPPAKPGRAKTITRREVQRKAEAAIGKPPPIKTPTLTKRSISINIPSIKREGSLTRATGEDRDNDDDHQDIPVEHSSRRGSTGLRNSPDAGEDDVEDDGSDGDNENDGDDEEDEEGGSESDREPADSSRKRLFLTLGASETKEDEDHDESDADDTREEEGADEDKMSDVKRGQDGNATAKSTKEGASEPASSSQTRAEVD